MDIFRFFSTLFDMIDFRDKKLPGGVHWFFGSDSRRSITSLKPILRNLEFPHEDPKYAHIRRAWISHFFWGKHLICGLRVEISTGNKNLWTSAILPENLGVIGQKLANLQKYALSRFYFPLTVTYRDVHDSRARKEIKKKVHHGSYGHIFFQWKLKSRRQIL